MPTFNTPAVEVIEWQHPNHGWVKETLCAAHISELLKTLRHLGMGCGGRALRASEVGAYCDRHRHEGQQPRSWLRGTPESTILDDDPAAA